MADLTHTLRMEYDAEQYLLFRLSEGVYAVPVASVNEIVMLPELMPIDERAPHYIGVVDLRGVVVPVIDLQLRLGRTGHSYSIDDYLMVLEHDGRQFALVVNRTLGVHRAKEQPDAARDSATELEQACVQQVVTIDDTIVMLLDLDMVVRSVSDHEADRQDATRPTSIATMSDADHARLRGRAERLRRSGTDSDSSQMSPVAIAEIHGEFFGFDLQYVREFCEVRQITPVPHCPEYIVGNVNVRGDVLTVIDISRELNLPRCGWESGHKIIVARTEELTVGILVETLHGVVYRSTPRADKPDGAAAAKQSVVTGTSQFGNGIMCLLNLPVLLEPDRWIVDAEVPHV